MKNLNSAKSKSKTRVDENGNIKPKKTKQEREEKKQRREARRIRRERRNQSPKDSLNNR